MNSPNVTTVPLPPAKGSSIGRNRADQALGLRSRGPDAASKLGKIQSPQMGRIHRPLRQGDSLLRPAANAGSCLTGGLPWPIGRPKSRFLWQSGLGHWVSTTRPRLCCPDADFNIHIIHSRKPLLHPRHPIELGSVFSTAAPREQQSLCCYSPEGINRSSMLGRRCANGCRQEGT